MKRRSLEAIASEFNGRVKCDKCYFLEKCTPEISSLCSRQFIKGFIKGAGYQRKKSKGETK